MQRTILAQAGRSLIPAVTFPYECPFRACVVFFPGVVAPLKEWRLCKAEQKLRIMDFVCRVNSHYPICVAHIMQIYWKHMTWLLTPHIIMEPLDSFFPIDNSNKVYSNKMTASSAMLKMSFVHFYYGQKVRKEIKRIYKKKRMDLQMAERCIQYGQRQCHITAQSH